MKKENIPEIVCFILFCISTIIISCFHELWGDEFQAWGISKDSIFNILFVIPHLEGHPPLWHLILKCFSFFNVNCELGIKIPNLLFMFGAAWLLIFKSPFPRVIKLALPFTYFIFYQYSIISRPYSIFCFAIFLAAYFYKERNEHPFKFISALALLCLSCAYGMIISTGIIIAWFIEIIRTKKFTEFFKDKRFFSMLLIFLLCLFLIFIIYPDKNVIYYAILEQLKFFKRFLYTIFVFPADALLCNTSNYTLFDNLNGNSEKFFLACAAGFFVNIIFFLFFKSYKKLLLFYIPYLMFLTVILCLYISSHHIGLLTLFYIFAFWIAVSEAEKTEFVLGSFFYKILILFISIVIIIQLYWSFCASFHEIIYPYCSSREITSFIKENKLYKYKIMARLFEPPYYINKNSGEIINGEPILQENQYKYFTENYQKIEVLNNAAQSIGVIINLYLGKNIVYSAEINNFGKPYLVFKKKTPSEIKEIKEKLRQYRLPDFILNQANPQGIYDDKELNGVNYILFKRFLNYKIWKDTLSEEENDFYIREDLYNKLFKQEVRNEEK